MKWYPISDGELRYLAVADGVTTLLFAIASAAFTFALDLTKDFSMATDIPVKAAATWGGLQLAGWIVGIVATVSGVAMFIWRGQVVKKLKSDTSFE